MNKAYRGACERMADNAIAAGNHEIKINWINISAKEASSGGANRVTKKLLDAGYRPDGSGCAEKLRADYESGTKVNGSYVRLPQEIWRKSDK